MRVPCGRMWKSGSKLTLITRVTSITQVKTTTAFSNHSSQFSKFKPELATLRNNSGCRDNCSHKRALVDCLDAQNAVTIVNMKEKTKSTMVLSRKKRR